MAGSGDEAPLREQAGKGVSAPTGNAGPDLNPWPLTIATYNIHGAVGTDSKFSPERIAAVIQETQADVIALQEVPLGKDQHDSVLEALRRATGFHCAEGPTCRVGGGRFGNGVLSRYPIAAARSIDLTFGAFEPRGAVDADLDCHGHPLRVVATHLGLNLAERRHQIEVLLERFDTAEMAVVLLGDINEWFVWGHSLRRLKAHFQKAPAPCTFPSMCPVFALDRIWIRPRQRLVQVKVHASRLARIASDHLPLVAHIGAHVEP
jgi:endonuclease/exonuclease/phosphatase family metal-dependent hydrolase